MNELTTYLVVSLLLACLLIKVCMQIKLHLQQLILHYDILYRGETFRKHFYNLGEVCSLIPSGVRILPLTASDTQSTQQKICKILGMTSPAVVVESPNKAELP